MSDLIEISKLNGDFKRNYTNANSTGNTKINLPAIDNMRLDPPRFSLFMSGLVRRCPLGQGADLAGEVYHQTAIFSYPRFVPQHLDLLPAVQGQLCIGEVEH